MIHAIIWRSNVPTVVSYLGGYEVDSEAFEHFYQALSYLAQLKGW